MSVAEMCKTSMLSSVSVNVEILLQEGKVQKYPLNYVWTTKYRFTWKSSCKLYQNTEPECDFFEV